MKKFLSVLISVLVCGTVFAAPKKVDFNNEVYDALLKDEQYEQLAQTIESKDVRSTEEDFYLGVSYFYLEKDDQAKELLQKVITAEPGAVKAYDILAGLYYFTYEYELAVANYNKILEIDPKNVRAYTYLGHIASDTNDFAKAADYYEKAFKYGKKADSAASAAAVYKMTGNYKKAVKYFDKAISLDPDCGKYYQEIILTYNLMDKESKTLSYKKKLRELKASGKDPDLASSDVFVLSDCKYNDLDLIFVETYEQTGTMYNVFACYVYKDGQYIQSILLEYDALTKEMSGIPYILCTYKDKTHSTLDEYYKKLPSLKEFIQAAKDVLDGKYEEVASSTTNS